MSGLLRLSLLVFLVALNTGARAEEPVQKKEFHVYLDRQVLVALEGEREVYTFDVVTGAEGKETGAGNYKILKKHLKYVSKTYGSEMPYTMFFTADGKAIHGTQMAIIRSYLHSFQLDSVGSHGCVGLKDDAAKILFDWAPVGTPVIVIRLKEER